MGEVIFLDNHDLSRFYSVVNEDIAKYKIALGWLLTYRGIPQLYYGDEIMMKAFSNLDGLVRSDFLGGWENDGINKFTEQGRTDSENIVFNFIKTLANFRKQSSAIKTGKMMQYLPENDVYTYFRYDDHETVMCTINVGNAEKQINAADKYGERAKGFSGTENILTKSKSTLKFKIKLMEILICRLIKCDDMFIRDYIFIIS